MPNPNEAMQSAAEMLDSLNGEKATGVTESAEVAQALAAVALAYEQQTANLIAYLNTGYNSWAYHPGENVLRHVQGQIEERLGLS